MKKYKSQLTIRITEPIQKMVDTESEKLGISKNLYIVMILKKATEQYEQKNCFKG